MFHYRVDFLALLREELSKQDVILEVYYGKPTPESLAKNDTAELPDSTEIPSWCLNIGGKEILLQRPPVHVFRSDLVICMQENRLLINYVIQLYTRVVPGVRFAFWGHGRNFQSRRSSGIREAWKRFLLRGSDWFFAYTEASRESLLTSGYDPRKITVFNNTIDVDRFRHAVNSVTPEEKKSFLQKYHISNNGKLGLFCGSMYPAKRIDELLQASILIKEQVPEFHLICIGDGPSATDIRQASESLSWVHFLGVQTGEEKARAYAVSLAVLNPGLVGLHIIDAFSAGVPMLTMDYEFHSPEFAYVESGVNSLVTKADVQDYAEAAVKLLTNDEFQQTLAKGASISANRYSLNAMVDAYASGIVEATRG